jgi:hypothetical protein
MASAANSAGAESAIIMCSVPASECRRFNAIAK